VLRACQLAVRSAVVSAAISLAPSVPAFADQPAMTAAQADEILSELRKIRELLEKNAVPVQAAGAASQNAMTEKVSVAARDSNTLGAANAPLTLVEFADFQCPFCNKFHATVFDELKRNFVDTGKLRYVSRDLPLPMHEHATEAARAARCAGDQNKYWEARHLLMLNQQKLAHDDLIGYASGLHLDVAAFTHCLNDGKYEAAVQQDAADAAEIGLTGTPTFILGPTQQKGRFAGVKIVGAQPYAVYDAKIRELLAASGASGGAGKAGTIGQ
jgi:protein-disulfide isomerase